MEISTGHWPSILSLYKEIINGYTLYVFVHTYSIGNLQQLESLIPYLMETHKETVWIMTASDMHTAETELSFLVELRSFI